MLFHSCVTQYQPEDIPGRGPVYVCFFSQRINIRKFTCINGRHDQPDQVFDNWDRRRGQFYIYHFPSVHRHFNAVLAYV